MPKKKNESDSPYALRKIKKISINIDLIDIFHKNKFEPYC